MTLIAAFKVDNIPFLLGDLLISRQGEDGPHTQIPTLPISSLNIVMPTEYLNVVIGLRRKICNLNDRFVIGWTGIEITAQFVVKTLQEFFDKNICNRHSLQKFFDDFEELGIAEYCILIGWILDKEGCVAFRWDSKSRELDFNEIGFVEGSGKNKFIEMLNEHYSIVNGGQEPHNYIHKTIRTVLGYACELTGSEFLFEKSGDGILINHPLHENFGGGIELIYLHKKKFKPVDKIAFIFVKVEKIDNQLLKIWKPPIVIMSHYYKDIFVFNTIRIGDYDKTSCNVNSDEWYAIEPIYKRHDSHNLKALQGKFIDPDYYCNFISYIDEQKRIIGAATLERKNDLISIVRENGLVTKLGIAPEFKLFIRDALLTAATSMNLDLL